MKFRFDTVSFFIGMAVATAIWWAVTLARPMFEQFLEANRKRQKERALRASSGLEDAHRKTLYKQTQGMHMAASLFALDEVVEAPRLLAPPALHEPNSPRAHRDIVEQAVPYLPSYPELGAFYDAPTLTIPEALTGGMNLVIIGQPGTGKTTALTHLAAQIANRAPALQEMHEYIPFLVHVADLGLPLNNPQKPEDFLAPIAEKLAQVAGVFDVPRIPGFVQYSFSSGRALLLLDGVDELPQPGIQEVSAYLRVILRQYPKIRVITTGSQEYVDGILSLGFTALTIMPWSIEQQSNFLKKWAALWQKYVAMEPWAQSSATNLDPVLLNRWLAADNSGMTPMEYTLKIWGAYAGDARGPRSLDAIEAHIRRLTPADVQPDALQVIGAQASLEGLAMFDGRRAREWTKSFETVDASKAEIAEGAAPAVEAALAAEQAPDEQSSATPAAPKSGPKKAAASHQTANASVISKLTAAGLLAAHGSRLRFTHPIFQGYLAGKKLDVAKNGETLLEQPVWVGQSTALRYLAAFSDTTPLISSMLEMGDPILQRPKLAAARLLRDAPREAPWRGMVMSALVQLLQDDDNSLALRGQAMSAFAFSGDPGAITLFRQLMRAPSNDLRQLAAIGAGLMMDAKAVDGLIDVVAHSSGTARHAACLALVAIGTTPALEGVATALLRGDEELRVIAAEALANNRGDGRDALREGITSEDILMRRAIVYGLARVPEAWAQEILEKTQLNDEQWAVRSVAVEMLASRQTANNRIPKKLTSPSETPWLIEFAGKYGMGISPGQPATDILLFALKEENAEYLRPALSYLRNSPTEGVLAAMYPCIYGTNTEARESVFQVLSEMALAGTNLPHPRQFGLG